MADILYLTTIKFDFGAVATLAEEAKALGISRPLLVSDRALAANGLVGRVRSLLPDGTAVFLEVPSNPTEEAVALAADAYRSNRCDGIVALGGGSPIDLAKGVALTATHPGTLESYAAIYGGIARITSAVAPLIAVPTTAGTGSEVGRAALITLADGRKLGFISQHLIPKRAICDPELTLGCRPGSRPLPGSTRCRIASRHCCRREPIRPPKPSRSTARRGSGRTSNAPAGTAATGTRAGT